MRIRTFRWEDLPAIVDVMNDFYRGFGISTTPVTLADIQSRWRTPYNHPDRDCFVAEGDDGHLTGFVIADVINDPRHAIGVYCVPPGYGETGRQLIAYAHEHFQRTAVQRGVTGESVTMGWRIHEAVAEAIDLFTAEGCSLVRTFYTMSITLPSDPSSDAMPLPDGFHRRPFAISDLERVFTAYLEIFSDHWGGPQDSLDEWRIDIEQPDFDPALWWVIYTGDDIAGLLLASPSPTLTAWVAIVGVRRAWRSRGLASALLHQCFAEFQQRGYQRVELGVDSDSATNAVGLYQRAGMHVRQRILYYDKVLSP